MSDSIGSQLAMLKELLKITSEHHSKQIDELNKFEPLNEKDKEFIASALKETAEATDPVRIMEKKLRLIKEADDIVIKSNLMDDLVDLLGQIDLATIFIKNYYGLDEIRKAFLSEKNIEILADYITLLTTVASNNVDVQNCIYEYNEEYDFLQTLMEKFVLNTDIEVKLRMRSLGSISAIVGHHTANFTNFLSMDGISKLRNLLESKLRNATFVARIKYTLNAMRLAIPEISEADKEKYASDILYLQQCTY